MKLGSFIPFSSESYPDPNLFAYVRRGMWNAFCVVICPITLTAKAAGYIISTVHNRFSNTDIFSRNTREENGVQPKVNSKHISTAQNNKDEPERQTGRDPSVIPLTEPEPKSEDPDTKTIPEHLVSLGSQVPFSIDQVAIALTNSMGPQDVNVPGIFNDKGEFIDDKDFRDFLNITKISTNGMAMIRVNPQSDDQDKEKKEVLQKLVNNFIGYKDQLEQKRIASEEALKEQETQKEKLKEMQQDAESARSKAAAARVPPEPAGNDEAVRLRFAVRNGIEKPNERAFKPNDKVQCLIDYVHGFGYSPDKYRIFIYPHKLLMEHADETFSQMGLKGGKISIEEISED